MITLTQGSHPQLEAWQLIQQAAAIVAGNFTAFRDRFLTHCPVIQGVVQEQLPSFGRKTSAQSANLFSAKAEVRAANREKHNTVREL
jgi:hypothetical protein